MPAHNGLYLYLWIAPHVLLGVLAFMLVRRHLVREFPAFFLYSVYEVVQFLLLFGLRYVPAVTGTQYWWVWLVGAAGSCAFRFAIVHEVFETFFRDYPALSGMGTRLYRWTTVILVIVAVAVVAYTPGSETDALGVGLTVIDRAVSIVQLGLLVLLLLLSHFWRFSLHNYGFGIAIGLGFFASMELGISAIRAYWGAHFASDYVTLINLATYHGCVVFWIVALFGTERESSGITSPPAHDLEQWNDALERLLQQ
jgi:hypothetical protein